jgi:antitoxin (DNA-binding transcriptional repressor) of toxin-antitoxin stability system
MRVIHERIVQGVSRGSDMKTETVDLNDAQARLKELVQRAISAVHVVLSENDKPVAQIVPLKRRVADLHPGAIWTSDDFDDPLPEDLGSDGK